MTDPIPSFPSAAVVVTPYDTLSTSEKHRVTTHISIDDFNYLFNSLFPQYGMQGKVTAALIARFVKILRETIKKHPNSHPVVLAVDLINNFEANLSTSIHPDSSNNSTS